MYGSDIDIIAGLEDLNVNKSNFLFPSQVDIDIRIICRGNYCLHPHPTLTFYF